MAMSLVVLTATLVLGALAFTRTHAANVMVVKATVQEFKIELSPTSIPAGSPVRFEVTNLGKLQA